MTLSPTTTHLGECICDSELASIEMNELDEQRRDKISNIVENWRNGPKHWLTLPQSPPRNCAIEEAWGSRGFWNCEDTIHVPTLIHREPALEFYIRLTLKIAERPHKPLRLRCYRYYGMLSTSVTRYILRAVRSAKWGKRQCSTLLTSAIAQSRLIEGVHAPNRLFSQS